MKGIKAIQKALENMPSSSGIYRMVGSDGDILYIGKAKNLKKRIYSYTQIAKLTNRLRKMVSQVQSVEITTTRTEAEALLLESRLIKGNQPPYNIMLRDDKSYPYIALDESHDFPRILKHRGAKKKQVTYFGPYPSVGAVMNAISSIQRVFLIRSCTDGFFKSRTRPCMEYEIKKCSAPCVDKISEQEYGSLVSATKDFLNGKSDEIRLKMQEKMEQASKLEEYEIAAKYRDRIQALNAISAKQNIYSKTVSDADVIAIAFAGGKVAVQILFIRSGKMLGASEFFPRGAEDFSEAEIIEHFIMSFYSSRPAPKNIIISNDIYSKSSVEDALYESAQAKVKIIYPQKGEKLGLVDMAIANAKASLERKLIEDESSSKTLKRIADILEIKEDIKRIEVFDNSHISGTNAIGAMIVAGYDEDGKWGLQKKLYRKFNVDSGEKKTGGDDFFMMRQVLKRRYGRIQKEAEQGATFPDLILIDGGLGQLNVATEVFEELGIAGKLNYVGIAKGVDRNSGREDFYLPSQTPFKLEPNDPALYLLQNLRDEAHRFAITGHRAKRAKSLIKSQLDEIPDIGSVRKKALLNHFGSVKAIKEATLDELTKAEGISKKTAEKVFNWFQ